VGQLELGERVADWPDLLRIVGFEQRQQRPHALDRRSHLPQVAELGRPLGEPETLAAQVHEAHDSLDENVLDGDPAELFLEARPELLLVRNRLLVHTPWNPIVASATIGFVLVALAAIGFVLRAQVATPPAHAPTPAGVSAK